MTRTFYQKCRDFWTDVQERQIIKGLHKYDEPFTPSHWTSDEIFNHALEESVDLVHYLVGMKEKNDELNKEIILLKTELALAHYRLEKLQPETKKPSYFDLDD
jgi:ATP sulfurylase